MGYEQNWAEIGNILKSTLLPAPDDTIFLFGGGFIGILAASLLKDELNITAICDNSEEKQGTKINGEFPCISPRELANYPNAFVLICTNAYYKSIHQQLDEMNIRHAIVDAYVLKMHLHEVENAVSLLDRASKEIYTGILLCRLTGNLSESEQYCSDEQYFCFPKFRYFADSNEVFVDCGAYVGDTVQKVVEYSLGNCRKIYAFEPNKRSYSAMQKRVEFLKSIWALTDDQIVCESMGVGAHTQVMALRKDYVALTSSSLVSFTEESEDAVNVVSLDEYLMKQDDEKVTFIKADIEGGEWDMLHGAQKIICRDKPKLAISIYHSIFDCFRIQNYLKSLVPDYQFHVRYHGGNKLTELILYAHI